MNLGIAFGLLSSMKLIIKNGLTLILGLCMAHLAQGNNLEQLLSLRGSWKFTIGDNIAYARINYDDSSWENIQVPSSWEDQGFHGYDGYAWYRKEFDGRSLGDATNIYLVLGYIDDVDYVYINGYFIGYSGSFPPSFETAWTAKREYHIPPEYLNPNGKNIISVRVYDKIQGGGIVSGDVGLYTRRGFDDFFVMEGPWKFQIGDKDAWQEPDYDHRDWPYIMVPASWKSFDRRYKSRTGWYRKTFDLPQRLVDRELRVLLGRIDDFDKVYINGVLIGQTNDGGYFGGSSSYLEYRNYRIPMGLLKQKDNVIAIQVIDLGGNAGIYQGPIGIAVSNQAASILSKY